LIGAGSRSDKIDAADELSGALSRCSPSLKITHS
jgi:hypothetical protein